jgi:hypothetical protein
MNLRQERARAEIVPVGRNSKFDSAAEWVDS